MIKVKYINPYPARVMIQGFSSTTVEPDQEIEVYMDSWEDLKTVQGFIAVEKSNNKKNKKGEE